MNIEPSEIAYKRQVGHLNHNPVMEVGLMGGLHLIMTVRKGKVETLGVGPHRAVARHIAKKKEKDLVWTELAKADEPTEREFGFCVPQYEAMTDRRRAHESR